MVEFRKILAILLGIQILFWMNLAKAQEVASESLSFQCSKGKQNIEVRIEKHESSCQVLRVSTSKKKVKFEDKASSKTCDGPFYGEIKSLKRLGYNCD